MTGPLRDLPHVAFRVADMDEALRGENVILAPFSPQTAPRGNQGNRLAPQPRHHIITDAARGVAASARPAAIVVPEIQPKLRARCIGYLGQLVKPDSAVPVPQRPRQRSRHHRLAPARIDHHKVIARAMHLHESQAQSGIFLVHRSHIRRTAAFCQSRTDWPLTLILQAPNQRLVVGR